MPTWNFQPWQVTSWAIIPSKSAPFRVNPLVVLKWVREECAWNCGRCAETFAWVSAMTICRRISGDAALVHPVSGYQTTRRASYGVNKNPSRGKGNEQMETTNKASERLEGRVNARGRKWLAELLAIALLTAGAG